MGGAVLILGLKIITYRRMTGRYDAWEAWIGGVWSVMLRWFVYLAKGAPGVAGPCVLEIELVAMGGQLGDSSDPALRFV